MLTSTKLLKVPVLKKTPSDQFMCVTRETAKRTGITQLAELTDPIMAKKFDSNGDGKGEMWIGAAGWSSTNVEKIRAKSYGYAETMELEVMGETLALTKIDKTIAQKQNFVFYCSYPHHTFTIYDLVPLKEPPHDPKKWKVLQPTDDPNWLEKSYAQMSWQKAYLSAHYAASLEKSHPSVAKLFSRANFDAATTSDMSYQIVVKKVPPEVYAKNWIQKHPTTVNPWIK